MRVELVEEVHDGVCVQLRGDDDHVQLVLRAMRTVVATLLLPLDPQEGQFLELKAQTTRLYFVKIHTDTWKMGGLEPAWAAR